MDFIQEYFLCDACENQDFDRIYNFSLRFHGVNFSDDLIYDRLIDEIYQCRKCRKRYTKIDIEDGLATIKKKLKAKN